MEEKESTVSASPPGHSATSDESPPPVTSSVAVPQLAAMNMNISMAASEDAGMERGIGAMTPPTIGGGSGSGSVELFRKKKRGRPRKYDSDGNLRMQPSFHHALPGGFLVTPPQTSGFSFSPNSDHHSLTSSKRGRGRPPGSGNWQLLASLGELFANTAGGDFTPHIMTVNIGEDVAAKILSFSQKGARGICVLSANGAVSNVTIRQPGSSGGILTYEGRFELLSLSGSFTVTENGGVRSRTGGLSVSLASPDGRVIGGGIAGLLLAASPIQIVVGSFMPNGYKVHKRKHQREQTMATVSPGALDIVTAAAPISQAKPNLGATCIPPGALVTAQVHEGTENNNANDKQIANNMATSFSVCWNGTEPTSNKRPSPDINVSVPFEEDVEGVLQRV